MATKTVEDIEQIEAFLRKAREEVAALMTMVDAARRVVSAKSVEIGDPASPQIISVSKGGNLYLGSESPMRIIGSITDEIRHTGDTAEVVLARIPVPANSMGPKGFVRITSFFRKTGTGTHTWRVKFGGLEIGKFSGSDMSRALDPEPKIVWNQSATNSQGSIIEGGIISGAVDTTVPLDVTLTAQNDASGDVSSLRFALVEAFYLD